MHVTGTETRIHLMAACTSNHLAIPLLGYDSQATFCLLCSMMVQVDADNLGSISTVVDIAGGEFYEAYEEVRRDSFG